MMGEKMMGSPSQDRIGISTTADPTPPRAKIKLRPKKNNNKFKSVHVLCPIL
jgi:hypothetical protein